MDLLLVYYFLISFLPLTFSATWHFECIENYCIKTLTTTSNSSKYLQSYSECIILCLDSAGLWPKPSDSVKISSNLIEIGDISKITFSTKENTDITDSVRAAFNIFQEKNKKLLPSSSSTCKKFIKSSSTSSSVFLNFDIADQNTNKLIIGTIESYRIDTIITTSKKSANNNNNSTNLNISIIAPTFFGARHALETLNQLIIYDDIRKRILIPEEIHILDHPVYPWRGLILDTSRNYLTPSAIKRTLIGMAASKLNTFHWHLTDTQSFPYVSKSHPELSELGAYSPSKIYSDDTVKDIIEYARLRGIRVVPEIDAPAHVGEGWQTTGVVTCFNWKPWSDYCVEPPCGQFDPSKDQLYDILEDLYGDVLEQFGNDIFHMGGDEVNLGCWNHTESLIKWITEEKRWTLTKEDYYGKVWPYFQNKAAQRLYKKAGKEIPVILWSSDLTALNNVEELLPPSKYIIQIWTGAQDVSIERLLEKNYSLIISNYDTLYLDCGFQNWVTDGNNWCSPYSGWQKIYENKLSQIGGSRASQILGGEAALWTEQAGSNSLDTRLWPRSAAFAETLWTEPATDWTEAEERILIHRERLVSLGIEAEELEPEWCLKYQQTCPIHGKFNK